MNPLLAKLIESGDGVVRREDCLAVVEHHVLDRASGSGRLIRALPGTYVTPAGLTDRQTTIRAAVAYAGPNAAASHLTALELWRLPVPDGQRIHLMTDVTQHLRGAPGVVVHRRRGFSAAPPQVLVRHDIPTTSVETSVVDSWPILDDHVRRAPAIVAVAERMTTPERLLHAVARAPRLGGRRHLLSLVHKLAEGCRSPLELWGYDHIFTGSGMPEFRRQAPVVLDGRTVYLDVFDEQARVNFELDGARYHGSVPQRERDLRRDAALAARGIVVVRYTHDRLVHHPDLVRHEVLAIIHAHRRR